MGQSEVTNLIVSVFSVSTFIAIIKAVIYISEIRSTAKETAEKLVGFINSVEKTLGDIQNRLRDVELKQASWNGAERRTHSRRNDDG